MTRLWINPELIVASEAAKHDNSNVAILFDVLGIKSSQNIALLTKDCRYVQGIFYGFRRSNGGMWISIGNQLERCENISDVGPDMSMKGGRLHTNWHSVL